MLRPESEKLSHLPQEALHDLPAFQSALLRAPKAGMWASLWNTSRFVIYLFFCLFLGCLPSSVSRQPTPRPEAAPFSPLVDLLLQVLCTEGFDFIVHTTGL